MLRAHIIMYVTYICIYKLYMYNHVFLHLLFLEINNDAHSLAPTNMYIVFIVNLFEFLKDLFCVWILHVFLQLLPM